MVPLFVAQFFWFFACWTAITLLVIAPWARKRSPEEQLSIRIAPEMFRVLGLGLLVPTLSPGMPDEFAISTAIGDSLTAVLALSAFIVLRKGHASGRGLAWVVTVVGLADLLFAFPHAIHTGAMPHERTRPGLRPIGSDPCVSDGAEIHGGGHVRAAGAGAIGHAATARPGGGAPRAEGGISGSRTRARELWRP